MLLTYKSSETIQSQPDFKADSTRILENLKTLLNGVDVRTEIQGNKIIFNRINRLLQTPNEQPVTIMPLRQGEIQLIRIEKDHIKVEWEIKLDSLLFVTFIIGAIAGFLSYVFLDTMLIGSTVITAAAWLSAFLAWRQYTIFEMRDLIQTSCLI